MARGPHPQDQRDLGEAAQPALREAVADLSWLIGRGYSQVAALKLVGDKRQLSRRQRHAVWRCAGSDKAVAARFARRVALCDVAQPLTIDGFNVLIPVERAIAGGPVLVGVDGAVRDLGGVHGTWRVVNTTQAAIDIVEDVLDGHVVDWVLDRPVSNSGRLAELIRATAAQRGATWSVRLEHPADRAVAEAEGVVVTSDAGILDRAVRWCNVPGEVLRRLPDAWVVDLRSASLGEG